MSFATEWARHEAALHRAWLRSPQLWSLDAVRERASRGDGLYFWPGGRSAIVGEVVRGDLRAAFNFWLGAGDREELFEMARRIEAWATGVHGVSVFLVQGRRGWGRFAARHGYRPTVTRFTKETP